MISAEPNTARSETPTVKTISKDKTETKKNLRRQIKDLQKRNEIIQEMLCSKESEVENLKRELDTMALEDVEVEKKHLEVNEKISTLSKRNRHLRAELEKTKSHFDKERTRVVELEQELDRERRKNNKIKEFVPAPGKKEQASYYTSINQLTEQLNQTKQKLFDALNQNTELKNNLKLAHKCIQQEVGENVNIAALTTSNSNWRGRAQQILALNSKVAELKCRLGEANLNGNNSANNSNNNLQYEDVGKLHQKDFWKKVEIERLTQQIEELKKSIETQKATISALKLRNQNLSDDMMKFRFKSFNLMEQSSQVNEVCTALKEELKIQKYQYEERIKEIRQELKHSEDLREQEKNEQAKYELKLENINAQINEKDAIIEDLKGTIKKLENDLRNVCGDFLFSCRDLNKEEFRKMFDTLEAEKKRLVSLVDDLNERLKHERDRNTALNESAAKQKIQICRLEARIEEYKKEEQERQEKKKRIQRINEYTNGQKIPTMIAENSSMSSLINTQNDINMKFEDLKNSHQFANEKIAILQDKLKFLMAEKEKDAKMFKEIIENSSNVVLQSIKDEKEKKASKQLNPPGSARCRQEVCTPNNTEIPVK